MPTWLIFAGLVTYRICAVNLSYQCQNLLNAAEMGWKEKTILSSTDSMHATKPKRFYGHTKLLYKLTRNPKEESFMENIKNFSVMNKTCDPSETVLQKKHSSQYKLCTLGTV